MPNDANMDTAPKKKVIRMNRKAPAEMVCYLCGEIIDELDPHIYIGKGYVPPCRCRT